MWLGIKNILHEGFVQLRFTPYPPTVYCVIRFADNLYPAGPIPLPMAEGGHASWSIFFILYSHMSDEGRDVRGGVFLPRTHKVSYCQ